MLKRIYHITDEGGRRLFLAGLCKGLFNIACLVPVVPLAMVADAMLQSFFGAAPASIPLPGYLAAAVVLVLCIYATYSISYKYQYLTSGQESKELRMNLADAIGKLPLSYLGHKDLSDLTTTVMDDVFTVESTLATAIPGLIGGLLSGIASIAMVSAYDWRLGLSLGAFLPIAVIVMVLSRRISEGTNKRNKQGKLAISDGIQEYLENIKVLRASQEMGVYQEELAVKIKKVIPGLVLYECLAGFSIAISYNIMRVGLGIVIIVGSGLLIAGEITSFTFLLFLFIAVRVYEPLSHACELLGEIIHSLVSAERIGDVLGVEEQTGAKDVCLDTFDIAFDHVTFGYNEETVIRDVTFTAHPRQITALVGPSGCGKSTLCKLAARFWDVDGGQVRVGGRDIRTIDPELLLRHVSIVFQDVVLFNDTIYNNIKIGKEDATRAEIVAAAKMARCDEFIERLPRGFDTVIGENGKTLSGGERQRISIARAFLKDAPIILLDESTASIDPENETRIQEATGRLIADKTVLIIAHKLRSIAACDKIVVLDEGRIVEMGTHGELMSCDGLYKRLHDLQMRSARWSLGA